MTQANRVRPCPIPRERTGRTHWRCAVPMRALLFACLVFAPPLRAQTPGATQLASAPGKEAPPSKAYCAFALQACDRVEKSLPEIARVAEVVADRHIAGGLIGVIFNNGHWPGQGPQFELEGRSGAMMNIGFDRPFRPNRTEQEKKQDVAIIGWQREPDAKDLAVIREAKDQGKYVIGLGPRGLPSLAEHVKLCDAWLDTGQGADDRVVGGGRSNTLLNTLNGWALMAETVAALARRGKTPPMWKSYLYKDALAWQDKYFLKTHFHDGVRVEPIAAGALTKAYLGEIRAYINRFAATQLDAVSKAADLIAAEHASGKKTIVAYKGHTLYRSVGQYDDKAWAEFHGLHHNLDGEVVLYSKTPEGALVLRVDYTGMHYTEWCIFTARQQRVIHVTSPNDKNEQPDLEAPSHGRVATIDMGYPFGDACVTLPGYPFKVFAPSGVMQCVAYEAINTEVLRRIANAGN